MTTTNNKFALEVLVIILLGSRAEKLQLLNEPSTSDETRLAFKVDADAGVREVAVRGAKSDKTRLAFKNDASYFVRAAAVKGAKSDATRLAFKNDASCFVRAAAVKGAKSDATRLEFINDPLAEVRIAAVRGLRSTTILKLSLQLEKEPWVRSAIQERMKVVGEAQTPQKSVA